jgi:DNA-binding transcriptional LysR family regulator
MRDLNLKATEHFEAVARLGSVTKAADELGVSPSAVSQQLRALETQFGVKLFRRKKRRLVLTLDGDRLYQTTTQAFGALRNARNAIAHQKRARTLTIRVSPSFGVRWLGPCIGEFATAKPDWNIRVDAPPISRRSRLRRSVSISATGSAAGPACPWNACSETSCCRSAALHISRTCGSSTKTGGSSCALSV